MWPFWTPKVGDRVLLRYKNKWCDDDWDNNSVVTTLQAITYHTGTRLYGFSFGEGTEEHLRWFDITDIRKVTELPKPEKPKVAPLVDATVLEEVLVLQKAVGSTEALLDLLRSVRSTYEVGKAS